MEIILKFIKEEKKFDFLILSDLISKYMKILNIKT